MSANDVNLLFYCILLIFSTLQICISIFMFIRLFAHRSASKSKRIDCLLLANIYLILLVISCFFIDMGAYFIFGYFHRHSSFDNLWCRLKAYMLYICGYTFFHAFCLQAIYRICRIKYPLQTKRQPFRLYVVLSVGQWLLSALELLPSLLLGDINYIAHDYHCQFVPSNMRGSLTVCMVGFLIPFTIMACCYAHTIIFVRKHKSKLITIKQRASLRCDLIILKRVIILLTVLTSSAIPHAAFPVIYILVGSLPTWLVSVEWALTILSLLTIALVIPRISPHLKELCGQKNSSQRFNSTPAPSSS